MSLPLDYAGKDGRGRGIRTPNILCLKQTSAASWTMPPFCNPSDDWRSLTAFSTALAAVSYIEFLSDCSTPLARSRLTDQITENRILRLGHGNPTIAYRVGV